MDVFHILWFTILHFFFLHRSASGQSRVECPDLWLRNGQKCYKLLDEYATYARASDICVHSHGGHLVRIWSQKEQNFIEDNFMDVNAEPAYDVWLGAMRVSDDNEDRAFVWSGGYKINFTYWYPGEPNNNGGEQFCLALWGHSDHFAKWWDTQCTAKKRVLCEKSLILDARADASRTAEDSMGIEFEIRSLYTQMAHLQSKRSTYTRVIVLLSALLVVLAMSIGLLYKFGEYSYLRMVIERRRPNMFTKFNNASTTTINNNSETTINT